MSEQDKNIKCTECEKEIIGFPDRDDDLEYFCSLKCNKEYLGETE